MSNLAPRLSVLAQPTPRVYSPRSDAFAPITQRVVNRPIGVQMLPFSHCPDRGHALRLLRMWLQLMWLQFEVVRGSVRVVWCRFWGRVGPKPASNRPQLCSHRCRHGHGPQNCRLGSLCHMNGLGKPGFGFARYPYAHTRVSALSRGLWHPVL